MNDRQLYDFLMRQKNPEVSRRYFFKWLTKAGVGGAAALSLSNLAFSGCVQPNLGEAGIVPTPVLPDQILVGVVGAFSGVGAFVGRITERGIGTAVARINATGGIGGRKVNWLKGDAGTDTAIARQKFTEFSQNDQVVGVIFATPLGINESRQDIKKGNVPTIATFSDLYSTNNLYPQDPDAPRSIFQFAVPGTWTLDVIAKYASQDRGYKKVGILYLALLAGEFERNVKTAAAKYGMDVVAVEQFQLNATELGPQLQRLRSSGCETLWIYGLPNDTGNIVKGLAGLDASYIDTPTAKNGPGWHPHLMGDPAGLGERQWAVLAGPDAKVGTASAYHLGGLLYLPQFNLANWMLEYLGTNGSGGEDGPADSFYTFVKAVEDAKSIERDKVVAAIENGTERKFSGLGFRFAPDKHLARDPDDSVMVTFERNEPTPTDPPYQLGREWEAGLKDLEFNPTHLVRPNLEANRRRYPEIVDTILKEGWGTQCTKLPNGTLSKECKIH